MEKSKAVPVADYRNYQAWLNSPRYREIAMAAARKNWARVLRLRNKS